MHTRTRLLWYALATSASVAEAGVPAPVLLWSNGGCTSFCQTGWYSSPAVIDIDGDGAPDIVAGSYDTVVLDATGATKRRATSASRVWADVAVADLAGAGTPSVIVARGDGYVIAYDGTLAPRSGWPIKPFASGEVRALSIANLDGDGKLQVVVGVAAGVTAAQLDVYDAGAVRRAGWPRLQVGDPGYGYGIYNDNIAAADLVHAGHDQLVAGDDLPYLLGLDGSGNGLAASVAFGAGRVWPQVGAWVSQSDELAGFGDCSTTNLRGNFASSAAAVGDVDRDGAAELVIVGNVYDCSTFASQYHLPWLLRGDRSRFAASGFDWTALPAPSAGAAPLSEAGANNILDAMPNAVLADLDGDGRLEILYSSYDGKVHAYWLDKTEHGSWPFAIPGAGIHFASPPVVADLYHDGKGEVIFTTWPQSTTTETGKLYILDSNGVLVSATDLPAPASGWNGGLASPTLAFLPGNSDVNVIVNTYATGVVAYQIPGTKYGRTLWPTGRGSYRRNGVAFNDRIFADGMGG